MVNWENSSLTDALYTDVHDSLGYYVAVNDGIAEGYTGSGSVDWTNSDMPDTETINGLGVDGASTSGANAAILCETVLYMISGGTTFESASLPTGTPRDICINNFGTVYAAVDNTVVEYSSSGSQGDTINIGAQANTLVCQDGNANRIWAGDTNGDIHEIDTSVNSVNSTQSIHSSAITSMHRGDNGMVIGFADGTVSHDESLGGSVGDAYSEDSNFSLPEEPTELSLDESTSPDYVLAAVGNVVRRFRGGNFPGMRVVTDAPVNDCAEFGGDYGTALNTSSSSTSSVSYAEYDEADLESVPERLTASQTSGSVGVVAGSLSSFTLSSEQPTTVSTLMQPSLDESISASLSSTSAGVASASAQAFVERSTEWGVELPNDKLLTVDGVSIEEGWPDFGVGQEVTIEFIFEEGNHVSDYQDMVTVGEFLLDRMTETGVDYRQVPYYKEYAHPQAPAFAESYLWKLDPHYSIDVNGWWIIVTEIVDNTYVVGPWERVEVTGFVLAENTGQTRAEIKNEFEV